MRDDSRPNIVLITTDEQRFDTLPIYGNAFVKAPNLTKLAERGTVFRNAFVQSPVCVTSRACLQTGRYTSQHGVRYMEDVVDDTPGLPPWELTFMERLQIAGYRTAAFGKLHMYSEKGFHEMKVTGGKGERWTKSAGQRLGLGPLGRDYAAWLEERHPGGYEKIYEQRRRPEYREHKGAIVFDLPLEEYVDYWIAENTVEFIGRDHGKPFFVWCGFCGPHGPVDPPRPYDSIYPAEAIPLPANYSVAEGGLPRTISRQEDQVARRWIGFYYGLVTLIDDMVGRIVEGLKRKGMLDSTLVLFVSDHGEMMFDFGRTGKSNFYEPSIHVPLIAVPPGGSRAKTFEGIVEAFDVAPTILDYANAEVPMDMSASSLRPWIEEGGQGKELALSEFMTHDRKRRGVCVRTKHCKYAFWGHKDEQFFDLADDPLERHNAAGEARYQDRIDEHRLLLLERLMWTGQQAWRAGLGR